MTTAVSRTVERYVRLQTVKALAMAIVAWAVCFALGLREPLFLAFIVFLSAYVPIIGPIAGLLFPTVVALAQYGDVGHPAVLLVVLGGSVFFIANVIMPKVASDRLQHRPAAGPDLHRLLGRHTRRPGHPALHAADRDGDGHRRRVHDSTRWLAVLISKEGDPMPPPRGAKRAG